MSTLFDLPFEEPEPDPPAQRDVPAAVAIPSPAASPAPIDTSRRVFTVAQLTARIRSLLEQQFFEVWVEGELSNCKVWNTGHMYFTLKDTGAQI